MDVGNEIILGMGFRRLILRSPTMNTLPDCEVDDNISVNFIINSGIFDLSGGLSTPMIITVELFESETFTH